MGNCPHGMKEVRGGSVSYTAHSYPRGPETCTPQCKSGWRKKIYVPNHIRRMTVPAPCPNVQCVDNKPVKQHVTARVAAFCISKPTQRDAFVSVAVKPGAGIGWAKPGLMSRLQQNQSGSEPVEEQVFVNMNHGVAATAPVRGIGASDATAYCKAAYGTRAALPSEAQWEHAYSLGKIRAVAGYMELLGTGTRTNTGWMNLLISKFAAAVHSWAMLPDTMSYTATFRCVVPRP